MGSHAHRRGACRPALTERLGPLGLVALVGLFGLALAACGGGSDADPSRPAAAAASRPTADAPPPTVDVAPLEASEPVGPPAGSPWVGIRRDCGLSVPLSDGSALWLYCDTLRFTPDGDLEIFLNTSVARAEADAPLEMVDQPDRRGDLRPVIDPVPGYPPCTAGQGSFTWPTAALVDPQPDGADRVVVYFENVCVLPGVLDGYDVGVAEIVYDPSRPPDPNHPIVAEVLEPRLFARDDREPFGLAGVLVDDLAYVYRCPAGAKPCEVARAPIDDVADANAYRYWSGDGWSADAADAAPMAMPDPVDGTKPAVEWVEALDLFIMVNHPVESTDTVLLRVAPTPTGPWSAGAPIELPGCQGFYPLICFAAEVHEQLSDDASVGLTWFDPTVPPGPESPTRFAQVAISVDRDAARDGAASSTTRAR